MNTALAKLACSRGVFNQSTLWADTSLLASSHPLPDGAYQDGDCGCTVGSWGADADHCTCFAADLIA